MEFKINYLNYSVDEYIDGFAWIVCLWDGQCVAEQDGYSKTALEAQQDACNHAQQLAEQEAAEIISAAEHISSSWFYEATRPYGL